MERKMYEPTEKQETQWAKYGNVELPSDEEFKARWAKAHHGKTTGWGMMKRDHITSAMKYTREYQVGIWQGRVDRFRGMDYAEERSENVFNLGYYRGYTEYESFLKGWDAGKRSEFEAKYQ